MFIHPIEPVIQAESKILILGSFPSVESRKNKFYYAHPQNRFWKMLAKCYQQDTPQSLEEKLEFLSAHRLALFDVLTECELQGSSDSRIRKAIPAPLAKLTKDTQIEKILINGRTAAKFYERLVFPKPLGKVYVLPSTSAANAAFNLEKLCLEWGKALQDSSND